MREIEAEAGYRFTDTFLVEAERAIQTMPKSGSRLSGVCGPLMGIISRVERMRVLAEEVLELR